MNVCAGYLEQFQKFLPDIPQTCPIINTSGTDPTCDQYIASIPKCEIPVNGLTLNKMPKACQVFVKENINYPGCIALNKNNALFPVGEWRVYPTPTMESWGTNGYFDLYDGAGRFIGSFESSKTQEAK